MLGCRLIQGFQKGKIQSIVLLPVYNTEFVVPFQVFLKYYHIEQLNLFLREVIGRVVVMQAYIKGWLGARRYKKAKEKRENSAVTIQSGKYSHFLLH